MIQITFSLDESTLSSVRQNQAGAPAAADDQGVRRQDRAGAYHVGMPTLAERPATDQG